MRTRYLDLIQQTFDFPQDEFSLRDFRLNFHDIDLMELVEEHGTPLRFTYLPLIGKSIERARKWFDVAMKGSGYTGDYYYCYCTKSSHFSYVMDAVTKAGAFIETSSAYDVDIVRKLIKRRKLKKTDFVICNGFKRGEYLDNISALINDGMKNAIPILDNIAELDLLQEKIRGKFKVGIRIAAEEAPKFPFYTSRLGLGYRDIVKYYKEKLQGNKKATLKMLHFFINTGISDTAYYWNELSKCMSVYCELKKICPTLDSLDIGGGLPIKNSLAFSFDYQYMVREIINQIREACRENNVPEPDIFTEFGSFTVGESSGLLYEILDQKTQNDREKWNMINSSFMTTLPDTWAINRRFVMLPLNRWEDGYERVMLGGLTCDSDDYYNSEQHVNAIYLPAFDKEKPLYIGFFNVGAYQDTIGGYGGLHHCLIPQPKHILIDEHQKVTVFSKRQSSADMLKILGFQKW